MLINGSRFEECYASQRGGGFHHENGKASVTFSTFYNNSAGSGNEDSSKKGSGASMPSCDSFGRIERNICTMYGVCFTEALRTFGSCFLPHRSWLPPTRKAGARCADKSTVGGSRSGLVVFAVEPGALGRRLVLSHCLPLTEEPIGEGGAASFFDCQGSFDGLSGCGASDTIFEESHVARKV